MNRVLVLLLMLCLAPVAQAAVVVTHAGPTAFDGNTPSGLPIGDADVMDEGTVQFTFQFSEIRGDAVLWSYGGGSGSHGSYQIVVRVDNPGQNMLIHVDEWWDQNYPTIDGVGSVDPIIRGSIPFVADLFQHTVSATWQEGVGIELSVDGNSAGYTDSSNNPLYYGSPMNGSQPIDNSMSSGNNKLAGITGWASYESFVGTISNYTLDDTTTIIPEPTSIVFLGLGAVGLLMRRGRRSRQ